tara:strand:- start:970 stop:1149 length:180 start_codon:yes stop_codon:yes gene_type:complete
LLLTLFAHAAKAKLSCTHVQKQTPQTEPVAGSKKDGNRHAIFISFYFNIIHLKPTACCA